MTVVWFLFHPHLQRNLPETKIKLCLAKFSEFSYIFQKLNSKIVSANVKMQYSDIIGNFVPFGNFSLEVNLSIVYVISCSISKY